VVEARAHPGHGFAVRRVQHRVLQQDRAGVLPADRRIQARFGPEQVEVDDGVQKGERCV
jgi:hypothetical protein